MKKMIDANINRCCEALRFLEDLFRFEYSLEQEAKILREWRQKIRFLFPPLENDRHLEGDVGQEYQKEYTTRNPIKANFKRAQEALRVLEEASKIEFPKNSPLIQEIRYKIYSLESKFLKKPLPKGIYGIWTEKFALGRGFEKVLPQMFEGGIQILQYREKNDDKTFSQMVKECQIIRKITKDYGVTFMVNDFPTLMEECDADGIHIGQEDWNVHLLCQKYPFKYIGYSTHNTEQAQKGFLSSVDYLGFGPLFPTNIKKNPSPTIGLEKAKEILPFVTKPWVAIGGIKLSHIEEVLKLNPPHICCVSEILSSENIKETCQKLTHVFNKGEKV